MRVLLLGVGMQGTAALHDLVHSGQVSEVIAADRAIEALRSYVAEKQYGNLVRCERVDGVSDESINRLLALKPDVVIDLLPVSLNSRVAAAAVRHGVHVVNASYVTPDIQRLGDAASAAGVTILPELGLDPGIDLVLLGEAVRSLDRVEELISYGAGFPEPQVANNALKYKVSWTFEGVLKSYHRAGRVIRDGNIVEIAPEAMCNPEHIHELEIEGLGRLEAIPNGYVDMLTTGLGIPIEGLRNAGRYTLRWPGHCAVWKAVNELHLLDDEPIVVDGQAVDRKRFLAAIVAPHLQYADDERDVVIVRVQAGGWKDGQRTRVMFQVVDRRDLRTGFTAMSRTVGYTSSIGALMIGRGEIGTRGVLSPITDVPYATFAREIAKRGIRITSEYTVCR